MVAVTNVLRFAALAAIAAGMAGCGGGGDSGTAQPAAADSPRSEALATSTGATSAVVRLQRYQIDPAKVFVAGISSGAVLHAALRVARTVERADVVCLFADGGWKYLSLGVWTRPLDEARETIRTKVWW